MKDLIDVPEVADFRKSVDSLGKNRNSILIKTLYLTASRCNEFNTNICPSDVGKTRALGKLVRWNILKKSYPHIYYKSKEEVEARNSKPRVGKQPKRDIIRILTLKIGVLKQGKNKNHPEIQYPQKFKTLGLPVLNEFEPWCMDIVRYLNDTKERREENYGFCFNLTRQGSGSIVKKSLGYHQHHLRHIRYTHLLSNYGFTPAQGSLVTGWSMRSGFHARGQVIPANVDRYSHMRWQTYFRKLLVPLEVVKERGFFLDEGYDVFEEGI